MLMLYKRLFSLALVWRIKGRLQINPSLSETAAKWPDDLQFNFPFDPISTKKAKKKKKCQKHLRLFLLLPKITFVGSQQTFSSSLLSKRLIDTNRLYFPTIDTCGCVDAQMSTFPCLRLRFIFSDSSLLLLLLEVNTSFMCAFLCFISLGFS